MPTRDEMENVRAQIEQLEHSTFYRQNGIVMPVFRNEPSHSYTWSELTPEDKIDVMTVQVTWVGFDREQELDVIQNVLDGKDKYHWMDGILAEDERRRDRKAIPVDAEMEKVLSEVERQWGNPAIEPVKSGHDRQLQEAARRGSNPNKERDNGPER